MGNKLYRVFHNMFFCKFGNNSIEKIISISILIKVYCYFLRSILANLLIE